LNYSNGVIDFRHRQHQMRPPMSKNVSKILSRLIEANDPRAQRMFSRLQKLAAAEEQRGQREAADRRKARDAAIFVLGGALLAAVEAGDGNALGLAAKIAASGKREQDVGKLARAVQLGVIPASFVKRTILTLPSAPAQAQ